jgi:retron-type reverse transcriptase
MITGYQNRSGWRNEPKNGDETRVFGIPTIRNDINKKGMKSVADPQVCIQ